MTRQERLDIIEVLYQKWLRKEEWGIGKKTRDRWIININE